MMDCRTFALLLDTPETEWTDQQRQEMEAHVKACPDCAMLYAMRREMRQMDDETQPPAGFTASWQQKIRREAQAMSEKKGTRFPWKRAVAAVAAVAVLGIGTAAVYENNWGLSAPRSAASAKQYAAAEPAEYETAYDYDMAAEEAAPQMMYTAMDGGSAKMSAAGDIAYTTSTAAQNDAAKIIRTVNMTVKTLAYENDYQVIRDLTSQYGGHIESLSVSGDGTSGNLRRASFTLRVPSGQLDDFLNGARGVGTVSSYSESSDDVSENYHDIQTRLSTQQTKLQRLTELMAKAEDVSDLIELEDAVSETQYWIDHYTGQLRGYDSRVAESYVYLNLQEMSSAAAAETKELTLGERISNAVSASLETAGEVLQALVIFLVAALPWIIALAAVILVLCVVVRRRRARKNAAKQKTEE